MSNSLEFCYTILYYQVKCSISEAPQYNSIFENKKTFCRLQRPRGVGRGSWPLGYWDRRFESRSRHGCLSSSFCVVLYCVGRGLTTGWSLVQGVLPNVLNVVIISEVIPNWNRPQGLIGNSWWTRIYVLSYLQTAQTKTQTDYRTWSKGL
jgi:hypothetical protein